MSHHPMKAWRNLKCILPSKRNQCEKATRCMIPPTEHSGKGKIRKTMKKISTCKGLQEKASQVEQGIFEVKLLCIYTGGYVIIFVQTHRTYNTKEYTIMYTIDSR